MDLVNILRRVKKLLAIADDSRGNPNEAAAAAAQAEKIMRAYNIEHADVLRADILAGRALFGTRTCSANMKSKTKAPPRTKRVPSWAGRLAARVAMLNDVQGLYVFRPEPLVEFRGMDADAEVAAWMFDYLVGETIAGTRAFQAAARRTKSESASFRDGFVLAVCDSLRRLEEEKRREMEVTSSSRALVVSKLSAVSEHFGKVKYAQSRARLSDAAAAAAGAEAGRRVDVSRRGVGGNSSSSFVAIGG